jgi:hypothetical protein
MPQYSQEEAAGLLGQHLVKQNQELAELRQIIMQERQRGKVEHEERLMKSYGYTGERAAEVYDWMQANECANVSIALRELGPYSGGSFGAGPLVEEDEWQALMDGDYRKQERLAVNRALKEARGGGY